MLVLDNINMQVHRTRHDFCMRSAYCKGNFRQLSLLNYYAKMARPGSLKECKVNESGTGGGVLERIPWLSTTFNHIKFSPQIALELYFLIARFLEQGPCRHTAQVRQKLCAKLCRNAALSQL